MPLVVHPNLKEGKIHVIMDWQRNIDNVGLMSKWYHFLQISFQHYLK